MKKMLTVFISVAFIAGMSGCVTSHYKNKNGVFPIAEHVLEAIFQSK